MGLSQLSEKCQKCPKVETCDHKRMEALAYLPDPCEMGYATGGIVSASAVNMCDGSTVIVDKTLSVGGIRLNAKREDAAEEIRNAVEIALCAQEWLRSGRYLRR